MKVIPELLLNIGDEQLISQELVYCKNAILEMEKLFKEIEEESKALISLVR